ncbi:LysM peptidoglycan-binding domain-containing protein [Promicromonospora sp. MS192]|uniref:LysM peptidoglycan-binding domain-containing protein n=1 Tax=Promicromonospora sp. MS192 TaxID=3412684 RepID=UPI003C2B6A6F
MSTTRSTTRSTSRSTTTSAATRSAMPMSATAAGRAPTARERIAGLLAMLTLVAIVAGVPLLLLAAHHAFWPDDLSWATAPSVLASGTGLIVAGILVGWVLWAWLSVSILAQIVVAVRNVRIPHFAGPPQGWVARLVAAAPFLFATIPTAQALTPEVAVSVVATLHPEPAPASSAADPHAPDTRTNTGAAHDTTSGTSRDQTGTAPQSKPYTVQRNDTLWGLARDRLGDGARWREIFDLNRKVLGGEPDFLPTGVVLQLPIDRPETTEPNHSPASGDRSATFTQSGQSTTHVVERGESLWEIAGERLGEPARYREIVEASASTVQPGGDRLRDPDHIEPGWRLTIPPTTTPAPADTSAPAAPSEPPEAADRDGTRPEPSAQPATDPGVSPWSPAASPSARPSPAPSNAAPSEAASTTQPTSPTSLTPWGPSAGTPPLAPSPQPVEAVDETDEGNTSSVLVPGLTGAGVVLAAGLYLQWQRKRSLQLRHRRPGRAVRPAPAVSAPVEHTLRVSGPEALSDVERLDRLLLALAGVTTQSTTPRPALVAVELSATDAVLHLAEPTQLPFPWTGSDTKWRAPLNAADAIHEDPPGFKPYPMLVTIGQDGAGHTWLLDLERARHLVVTGDPDQVADFGRALAAELTLNPWGENLTPHTIGLDHIPTSLGIFSGIATHHTSTDDDTGHDAHIGTDEDTGDGADASSGDDEAWITQLADGIRQDYTTVGDDREWFYPVIAAGPATALPALTGLIEALVGHPARPGGAVVTLAAHPTEEATVADVNQGRIRITDLGLDLDLAAVGLTQAELAAAAAIVEIDSTDALDDTPMPIPTSHDETPALTDATGIPRPDTVERRPTTPSQPAGPGSVLPAASDYYAATGVTSPDELDRIAPVTPPQTMQSILDSDPELDADVAEWFTDTPVRPRLMLLGPVSLRTGQLPGEAIRHKARLIEYAAYLGLHPNGTPRQALAEALQFPPDRIRKDLAELRKWLGTNARTGQPHVPTTRQADVFLQTGSEAYQVHDLLIDTDLFLRLRVRAHARGAAGITDLRTALDLVRGRPFDLLRRDGWSWLTEGERYDLIIGHAVVDVAHTVFLQAMADGDHDLARHAATTGLRAVPEDETLRLDLVQLEHALGDVEAADRRLREEVLGRDDHGLDGLDIPERTQEALDAKRDTWQERRRARTREAG